MIGIVIATDMDFLRLNMRKPRLDRVRNCVIRQKKWRWMDVSRYEIKKRQLIWFGYACKMHATRLTRGVFQLVPRDRKCRKMERGWKENTAVVILVRNLAVKGFLIGFTGDWGAEKW